MHYLWSRNKHVACQNVDGHLRISTSVGETFFAASVTVVVRLSDLNIVSVEAAMPRGINEECVNALPVLQKVVGQPVRDGLTKRVDALIGGPHGCTHMANLVLESCHTAAVSYRQVKMAEAIANGLKSDDFYREWIKTRPKELRNSCVAFADDSPLLARITSPAAQAASERAVPISRSGAITLPILGFSRNKLIGVGRLDKDTFLARGIMDDNVHSMQIEVEVRRSDLTIVAARGQMLRVPNDVCPEAPKSLPNVVGLALRPGLTTAVDREVARKGCPHLANLFLEACHGIIQGTLGAEVEDCRKAGVTLDWADIRARWLESMPMLHNSCLAYRDGSTIMRKVAQPVA